MTAASSAYQRIFKRVGAKNVIDVQSDSGMMGGSLSHEFMLLSEVGEDTLALCGQCGYRANMEAAECIVENRPGPQQPLEKVATPGCKTIDELQRFLKMDVTALAKAVVYQKTSDDSYVVALYPGRFGNQ